MKQIVELKQGFLAIYNNSNNWLLTGNAEEAGAYIDNDDEKKVCRSFHPVTITLHITNLCNMNCKYCFARAGTDNQVVMNMEIIRKIVKFVNEIETSRICFDFHGGEPLTQKKLIFEIVDYVERNIVNKHIDFYIQTNATLIDDEMAGFFRKHHFFVGISLDGNKETNDSYRIFDNGKGSFDRILNGIGYLKKHMVSFSCLAVVVNPKQMIRNYEFFIASGIYNVQFMPVMPQGRADDQTICMKDWTEFAKCELELFDRALEDRKRGKPVILSSSFTILSKILLDTDNIMCMRKPCGAALNILSVDEEGNLLPCDAMSGIKNTKKIDLGNIKDYEHVADFLESSKYQSFIEDTGRTVEKCNTCFCKGICCGGCSSDVYNAYGTFERETPMCEYYSQVIKGYFEVLFSRKDEVLDYIKGRNKQ